MPTASHRARHDGSNIQPLSQSNLWNCKTKGFKFLYKTYSKSLKGLRHTIKLKDVGVIAPMKPNKVTKKSNLQDKRCVHERTKC